MNEKSNNVSTCIIVGGGGHARVLADIAQSCNIEILGFLDPELPKGSHISGYEILGDDSYLETIPHEQTQLLMGLGTSVGLSRRLSVAQTLQSKGFDFPSVISPSAILSGRAKKSDQGAQILAGAIIQTHAQIGSHCVVNTGAIIEHDVYIGAGSFVGPGATLCGGVRVGENSLVGSRAIILPGILIGSGAVVGAAALVTKDVKAGATVAGNPARVFGDAYE
jgi:sugar O-acyltransferase (sialic acid O-acetyltransferase NeuD family)